MDKENIQKWFNTIKLQYERLEEAIADLKWDMQTVENAYDGFESTVLECLDELEEMADDDD